MRVSSGELKGRAFDAPKGNRTHPMSDRVKTALFNILGDISGFTVLDAYAGSGALAFEALSRGAKTAQMVEIDTPAMKVILKNIELLKLGDVASVTRANASSWSKRFRNNRYDLVICDPPFDHLDRRQLSHVAQLTKPEGWFVLSFSSKVDKVVIPGLSEPDVRNYGDQNIAFYRRITD